MNGLHSLLLQKGLHDTSSPTQAVDLVDQFGFVCTDISFPNVTETKDITTTDWKDQDGEDVYIPERHCVKAFDLEVKVACTCIVGKSTSMLETLQRWFCEGLPQSGDGLTLWLPLYVRGFKRCYFKGSSDVEYTFMDESEVLECTLKFRVCDPVSTVQLKKESSTLYRLV